MWSNIYQSMLSYIKMTTVWDVLDILIVAYVIYKALVFIRDTRALNLLKGIGVIFVIMQLSYFMSLNAVNFILRNAMQVGVLAILIVFQPEFRRALERVGRQSIGKWFNLEEQTDHVIKAQIITQVVRAAENLSKSRIGGLIVLERETKMGDIISTGVRLGAEISAELLVNIFIPKTPLHDGAVIIRENRIEAAACFLPLSQNPNLSKELGTRHRAGLGISEDSDALVVIVSEETGRISVAQDGDLQVGLNGETLTKFLTSTFVRQKDKMFKRNLLNWKERNK